MIEITEDRKECEKCGSVMYFKKRNNQRIELCPRCDWQNILKRLGLR